MNVTMDRVLMFDHNIKDIGLYTRPSTQGEEFDLVEDFIEYYIHNFLKNNKLSNLAIFVEPKVASGFPDIVFASYSPKILENWSAEREKLGINDLKVLSQLLMTKGSTGSELITKLKMPEKDTIQAIERLLDANMVMREQGVWKPVEIKKIYNIRKLISVEAKMTDIKKVAEQSLINTWFASQSYALTNTSNPQSLTIKKFERQGIGLYCKKRSFRKIVEAKKLASPSSYQSLQFNEWIGRTVAHLG